MSKLFETAAGENAATLVYVTIVETGLQWSFSNGMVATLAAPCPQLITGTAPSIFTLSVGQGFLDPTGEYVLMLQSSGLYVFQVIGPTPPSSGSFNGKQLGYWEISSNNAQYFLAQTDGNAVISDAFGNLLSAANNGGYSALFLAIQSDGNVVLYTSCNSYTTGTNQ
jgi:hypothetical protein